MIALLVNGLIVKEMGIRGKSPKICPSVPGTGLEVWAGGRCSALCLALIVKWGHAAANLLPHPTLHKRQLLPLTINLRQNAIGQDKHRVGVAKIHLGDDGQVGQPFLYGNDLL